MGAGWTFNRPQVGGLTGWLAGWMSLGWVLVEHFPNLRWVVRLAGLVAGWVSDLAGLIWWLGGWFEARGGGWLAGWLSWLAGKVSEFGVGEWAGGWFEARGGGCSLLWGQCWSQCWGCMTLAILQKAHYKPHPLTASAS